MDEQDAQDECKISMEKARIERAFVHFVRRNQLLADING
jgi:hypothetical protein